MRSIERTEAVTYRTALAVRAGFLPPLWDLGPHPPSCQFFVGCSAFPMHPATPLVAVLQGAMRAVIMTWAAANADVGYKQGMHELAAPGPHPSGMELFIAMEGGPATRGS